MTPASLPSLSERLLKRAKEDRACAENSAVIVAALGDQMERFEARDEQRPWNTYAVRMAVDHRNSVKRDTQFADDLIEAAAIIAAAEDARIAAADVIEALKAAAPFMRSGDGGTRGGIIEMNRLAGILEAAIAKAEGRS